MVAFDDLAGLTSIRPLVKRLFTEGVHGLLIYGSEGAGQEDVAKTLAQAWLCKNPSDKGGCGECQPCGAFSRGSNADFLFIKPWGKSNLIKTGAIRETPNSDYEGAIVQDFARTLPLMSSHKVVVFQDVDRLVSEAANSFLKMLEEPGPQMRFLLTTRSIGRVLPTIISRCLTVPCEKPERPEGLDFLGQVFYEVPQYLPALEKPETIRRLTEIAEELPSTPRYGALQLSERLRDVADSLPMGEDSARTKQAAALEIFAAMIRNLYPERGDWIAEILEAHRRIVGNAVGGMVLDGMFMRMAR